VSACKHSKPREWALLPLMAVFVAAGCQAADITVQVVDASGAPAPDVAVVLRLTGVTQVPPPLPPVEVVQEKMRFSPAMVVLTPGTRVRFTNRDPWDHHVRGNGPGSSFEFRVAGTDTPAGAASRAAETVIQAGSGPIQLGCFIHSAMQGNLYLSESPWYGVTDANGVARIPHVPASAGSLVLWHPMQLVEAPATPVRIGTEDAVLTAALNVKVKRRRG